MDIYSIPRKRGIYKLINKINGKFYIGKSVNLYKRISSHRHPRKGRCSYHMLNALLKYGIDNFDVEIIYLDNDIDNNILLFLETSMICELNATDKSIGYNTCLYNWDNTGTKMREETKRKIAAHRPPNLGRVFSPEWRDNIGKSRHLIDMSMLNRKINQINLQNGVIIKTWNSIKDAHTTLNISRGNIITVCGGKRNHAGGFGWNYAEPSKRKSTLKKI